MTGIYGFASTRPSSAPNILLSRMFHALPAWREYVKQEWLSQDQCAGLGLSQPVNTPLHSRISNDGHQRLSCFIEGTIHHITGIGEIAADTESVADTILQGYCRHGADYFKRCNGSFNVAIWDQRCQRLVLANDKLGHRPLFYFNDGHHFFFASYLARVLSSLHRSPEIDPEGFGDLLAFGYILNNRTLFRNARMLPPGSVLHYERGQITQRQYWSFDRVDTRTDFTEDHLERLSATFNLAVKRSLSSTPHTALSLTGGLDSRCILAAAANQGLAYRTHSGGLPDSTDVAIARDLSKTAGVEHYFEPIEREQLTAWLMPMVYLQGATVATLHSHPCQQLQYPFPFEAMVQGIGGEFARGADWINADDLRHPTFSRDTLFEKLLTQNAKRIGKKGLWNAKFGPSISEATTAHISELHAKYHADDHPISSLKYISLYDLGRTQLNKAMVIVRTARDVHLPYFDHDWIEAIASIPISQRVRHCIQKDLIGKLYPRLLNHTYSTTMLPMNASAGKVWLTERLRRTKRKIASFTGMKKNGYPRPNHHYASWIREDMQPYLAGLLGNPHAAFREYLDDRTFDALLEEHFSGAANWEGVISACTVFELAHQIWIDPLPDLKHRLDQLTVRHNPPSPIAAACN